MRTSSRWPQAVLAGLASSMRTTAGPAMLAARGRVEGGLRVAILLASVSELALDKTPLVGSRVAIPALGGRILAGAYTGQALAGPIGVAAGAVAAVGGTFASSRARQLAVTRTGWPDFVVALGEDIAALTAAAWATRPADPRSP